MLEDHEARISALEASRTDYRAVLAAINALGANQRDHALALGTVRAELATVRADVSEMKTELADFRQETQARYRSFDEHMAEIRDLIIGRL